MISTTDGRAPGSHPATCECDRCLKASVGFWKNRCDRLEEVLTAERHTHGELKRVVRGLVEQAAQAGVI